MRRWLLAASFALLLSACDKDPCDERSGSVLCGYCDQDAATTSNPAAGKCRYCDAGTTCTGEICGDLSCVSPDGGGGGTCTPTGCPANAPWYGCGSCWPTSNLCNTRGTSILTDDCSVCRKCP